MPRKPVNLVLVAALLLFGLIAPGCETIHGVVVTNKTDRTVKAELLQLRNDGEMTSYATQTLVAGGEYHHKMDSEEHRPGMRVRFRLADQAIEDGNWVMLNVPDSKDRTYDLFLTSGRLTAKEIAKPQKIKAPE